MEALNDVDDIIESSQVPTLRASVRKGRKYYKESPISKPTAIKRGRKSAVKRRSNETVSQCMQQEWKSPRVHQRTALPPVVTDNERDVLVDLEEYVKIATQQEAGPPAATIDCVPSVNLFEQQRDVVKEYMFNEISEAQEEQMLDKILQEFRTNYKQASATMAQTSPVANVTIPSPLSTTAAEVSDLEHVQHAPLEPLAPGAPEKIDKCPREPIVQLLEFPNDQSVENDIQPTAIDGCLDLSMNRNRCEKDACIDQRAGRNEFIRKSQKVQNHFRNEIMFSMEKHHILEHRISPIRKKERINQTRVCQYWQQQEQEAQCKITTIASSRSSTTTRTTQTYRSRFSRNAGIQHRPVASFDMTKANVITLARTLGYNPDGLYLKMKEISTASQPQALWYARHLPLVFTRDDPYFANLEYFMSPRF